MSIVKSISVGDGDMFYINHNSENFTIIDCCMDDDNEVGIVRELKREMQGKKITRFISTHPDDDHIKGLDYLDKEIGVLNFYCVKNEATKEDETTDFEKYCELRDSTEKSFYIEKGCSRKWMNEDGPDNNGIFIGSSGINILWPIITNEYFQDELQFANDGGSPNNISPIIKYSLVDGATILWMGDLETDFMENIKDEIKLSKVNILFAPHHGRDSGTVPSNWLDVLQPDIIIIGEANSEHLNYYDGYNTITQNSAGDIILECASGKIHIYVGSDTYTVDFLDYENKSSYNNYLGTLNL
jgi:beta-lactamase superfamily II metal-dependent hydrolase